MNDLDKLKNLLFGEEKESLDSIKERVERPETRACDVADILPEAIYQSHRNGDHLTVSLTEPVRECLEQAVHEEPQKFGNALYPVMGPAIRRSIMEALRGLAQQINAAVEQSLTPRGIRWRLSAWRAGVPFGEYVLQKTLLYRVEQAYLIGRENGLLMAQVHHDAAPGKDSDAVSAMFTAIQDFVQESFSPDRSGRLETADMGEFTLWAIHGPHAVLAAVVRGVPPKALRADLAGILERIHFRYGEAMRTFAGDGASLRGVDDELGECLEFEALQAAPKKKSRVSTPLLIVALLLATVLAYFAYTRWVQQSRIDDLDMALRATPGLYVDQVVQSGNGLVVSGMRDPLAPTPSDVAESLGLRDLRIVEQMPPFQSLAPEMIQRRVIRQFGVPASVSLKMNENTLIVDGPAPVSWRSELSAAVPFLAGVDAVAYRNTPDDLVATVRQWLAPPDGVQLAAADDLVTVTGTAPQSWIRQATTAIEAQPTDFGVDLGSVRAQERVRLEADVRALSGRGFYFTDGIRLADGQRSALPGYVDRLNALRDRAAQQGLALVLTITGFTDSVGNRATNERLAARRTETVAELLEAAGYRSPSIEQRQRAAEDENASSADFNRRRVSVDLRLEASSAE